MNQEHESVGESVGESAAVEIRSLLALRIIMGAAGLFFSVLGVLGFLCAVLPQLLEHRPDKLPGTGERLAGLFFSGPFGLGMGLYASQALFYRLRADAYGLTESLGWKEKRTFWSDVDSYTMEPRDLRHQEAAGCAQAVLRDAKGNILFRSLMACGGTSPERTGEFWNFVQARLQGKQKPYTPPPTTSIYKGKSLAWKARRIALLGLGILSFVGLWSTAVAWAMAQPALPRWVEPAALFSVYAIPIGAAHAVRFFERRRKKMRAESEGAAST